MNKVDIVRLKERALSYPEPVRSLILSEPDSMESNIFIEKVGTWDRLLKMHKEA